MICHQALKPRQKYSQVLEVCPCGFKISKPPWKLLVYALVFLEYTNLSSAWTVRSGLQGHWMYLRKIDPVCYLNCYASGKWVFTKLRFCSTEQSRVVFIIRADNRATWCIRFFSEASIQFLRPHRDFQTRTWSRISDWRQGSQSLAQEWPTRVETSLDKSTELWLWSSYTSN